MSSMEVGTDSECDAGRWNNWAAAMWCEPLPCDSCRLEWKNQGNSPVLLPLAEVVELADTLA